VAGVRSDLRLQKCDPKHQARPVATTAPTPIPPQGISASPFPIADMIDMPHHSRSNDRNRWMAVSVPSTTTLRNGQSMTELNAEHARRAIVEHTRRLAESAAAAG